MGHIDTGSSFYPDKVKIVKQEVDVTKISAHCEDCGQELICSQEVIMTYPVKYQYICPNCTKGGIVSSEKYPQFEYTPKQECNCSKYR